MKFNKIFFPLLFLAVMKTSYLLAITLDSTEWYDPSESIECFSFGDYTFSLEFLYWKSCFDDLHYAVKGEKRIDVGNKGREHTKNKFKIKYVNPTWEPGVRVSLMKKDIWNQLMIRVDYTYLAACKSSSISSDNVRSIVLTNAPESILDFVGDKAKSSWQMQYHYWDLVLLYPIRWSCGNCNVLSPFFGLDGLILCQGRKDKLKIFDQEEKERGCPRVETKRDADYRGVGPVIGADIVYCLLGNIRLFGNLRGTILVGEVETKDRFQTNEGRTKKQGELDWRYKGCECVFVSGVNMGFGILYDLCVCDRNLTFTFGYEFTYWNNTPTFRDFLGDKEKEAVGLHTSSNRGSAGLHGITTGLLCYF